MRDALRPSVYGVIGHPVPGAQVVELDLLLDVREPRLHVVAGPSLQYRRRPAVRALEGLAVLVAKLVHPLA
jgi:hypothetical protein